MAAIRLRRVSPPLAGRPVPGRVRGSDPGNRGEPRQSGGGVGRYPRPRPGILAAACRRADMHGRDGPARRRASILAALADRATYDPGIVRDVLGTPSTGDLGLHDSARVRTPAARLGHREFHWRADNAGRDVSLCDAAWTRDISAQPVAR